MKKLLTTFALIALLLGSTSGFNEEKTTAGIGEKAPDFVTKNQSTSFRLSEKAGRYVLLSFWKSSDAESRIRCKFYENCVRNASDKSKIEFVAVNFDSRQELFEQIVKQDNLEAHTQFNVTGAIANHIRESYGLTGQLGTLLIDPDGRIIAANPSKETIARLAA